MFSIYTDRYFPLQYGCKFHLFQFIFAQIKFTFFPNLDCIFDILNDININFKSWSFFFFFFLNDLTAFGTTLPRQWSRTNMFWNKALCVCCCSSVPCAYETIFELRSFLLFAFTALHILSSIGSWFGLHCFDEIALVQLLKAHLKCLSASMFIPCRKLCSP